MEKKLILDSYMENIYSDHAVVVCLEFLKDFSKKDDCSSIDRHNWVKFKLTARSSKLLYGWKFIS